MHKTLQTLTTSLSAVGFTSVALIKSAFAQGEFAGETPDIAGLPDAADEDSIRDIIITILEAVLNFLALIAVVFVVVAGIRLIVSQGEDEAKDKAKKTILYALIGLVIVLFARVIVSLVTEFLAEEVAG